MNDSLDLRNRILKMRESNNLNVTKKDASNNNLMSEFENSIKKDDVKIQFRKNVVTRKDNETASKEIKKSEMKLFIEKILKNKI